MEKCEHGAKITHFCIYEYCSAKEAAGCENCLKKYHSHVGQAQSIRTEDVDNLTEKFSVQNLVKPKCRQFQESVFSFFTQIKTEISQTIDIVCKGMVNKIGYPLLSNLNHLSSYKRIKNKEYKKLTPKELRKIYLDCKFLDVGNVSIRERELYIEEIVKNFATVESMEKLMKEYENLVIKICKNFRHDSSAYKKIQDLRKYLNTILKIDQKEANKEFKNALSIPEANPSDFKVGIKQMNSPIKESSNSKMKIHQSQQDSSVKPVNSRSQYKHLRNFSIEKEVKMNEINVEYEIKITDFNSNNYESKEKEILERKDKLMKMMSLKEKSVGNALENSTNFKNNESALLSSPLLLKYQKHQNQTLNEKLQKLELKQGISQMRISAQNSLKVQTPLKTNQKIRNFSISPQIKHSNSVRSFKEEPMIQNSNHQVRNQESQDEEKYKYGMGRLPSSESNSSQTDYFFNSSHNSVPKTSKKKNKIQEISGIQNIGKSKAGKYRTSESSHVHLKNQIDNKRAEKDEKNYEKSAVLYIMALQEKNLDKCVQYLKAAIDYCPTNISAVEYLTSFYIDQHKAKECLDLCNEYLVLLKKQSKSELKMHFLINKSASLNMLGRYSESITLLESQILNFEDAKMFKNLGDAYFSVGINEKCQYNYEKAIKLNPKFDEAMHNLAVCIFTQGSFFNADIWISKALEIDVKNVDYQTLKREIVKRLVHVREENQGLN